MIKFNNPLTAISIAASLAVVLSITAVSSAAEIVRTGEGRNFYNNIMIPAGAETLYLSGSGAQQQVDGTWGDMEQQTIDTFGRFQETLEAQGWSLEDIVQVRAFAVSGDDGELDFAGFNAGYQQFFGSEKNAMKPVRSFVEIAGLVVPGWLIEIEIRAARMPD
jgi:enamine deaminase RidA (YjgF/YER057c/UK114 family)